MSDFIVKLKEAFLSCKADDLNDEDRQVAALAMSLYLNKNEEIEEFLEKAADREKLWVAINKAVQVARGEGYVYTHHGIQRSINSWLSPQVQKEVFLRLGDLLDKIQSEFGVPAYVTSGTLLGIVRDGALIAHDDDIDAAYVSFAKDYLSWALEWRALIDFINNVPGCQAVRHLPGLMRVSLKLDSNRIVKFDLFSSLQENSFVNEYPLPTDELRAKDVLPLEHVEFLGAQIPTPNRPEALLRVNYGDGWGIPDPTYRFNWSRAEAQYAEKLGAMSSYIPSAEWIRHQLPVRFGDFKPGPDVDFTDYKIHALRYLIETSNAKRLLIFGAQNHRLLIAAQQEMARVGGSLVIAELDTPLDEKFGEIDSGKTSYFSGFPSMASGEGIFFGSEDVLREKLRGMSGNFDAVYLDTGTRARTSLAAELLGPLLQEECHIAFDDFIFETGGVFYSGQYEALLLDGCFGEMIFRPLGRSRWSQVVMRASKKLRASHLIS